MTTMIQRMRARTAANAESALPRTWLRGRADDAAHDEAIWANYLRAVRELAARMTRADAAAMEDRARRVADLDAMGREYGYA